MGKKPQTWDEIRAKLNNATATDEDIDEIFENGYDYSSAGPRSREAIEARKPLWEKNRGAQPDKIDSSYGNNDDDDQYRPQVREEPYLTDKQKKENLRKLYANDNVAYKKALGENDLGLDKVNEPYKLKSISQAYYNGEIDKNTRDYMLADVFAKGLRNIGRDIGNVGAQFSGGAIDTNREASLWDERNRAMAEGAIGAERNAIGGSSEEQAYRSGEADITGKNIQNRVNELKKHGAETFASHQDEWEGKAEEARKSGDTDLAQSYQTIADLNSLIVSQATGEMGTEEYAALAALETLEADPRTMGEILTDIRGMVSSGAKATEAILGMASGLVESGREVIESYKKPTLLGTKGGRPEESLVDDEGFVHEKTFTGKPSDKINLRASLQMWQKDQPTNNPYKYLDVDKALSKARRDGYNGGKDINLLRWLKDRYMDAEGSYSSELGR